MDKLSDIRQSLSAPNQHQQIRREIESGGPKAFAEQFEAIFLRRLLKQMNKSMLSGGLFGDSHQGKIYQGMFTDSMAEQLAENGGIGLAEVIARGLEKHPSFGAANETESSPAEVTPGLNEKMYQLRKQQDIQYHPKATQGEEDQ